MPNQVDPRSAVRDLLSPEPDTAARAADALFADPTAAKTLSVPQASQALTQSVERGNRTAAAILLLGYVPSAVPLLKELLLKHGTDPVKLKSWSRAVPLGTAAKAALSRLGDREVRHRLLSEIPQYEDNIRVFLLDILPYIDAPEVWHAMLEYLNDTREIPEDVPSGAARRRVCDHAVDAFLNRVTLPVSFQRNPGGRYGVKEIEEVAKLFRQTVPS